MTGPNKAKLLRDAIARPEPTLGFDAVWASGFEISASFALPDANALSMGECLQVVRGINSATALPVIADCDTGYGNAINVHRMVQEYERAGVAAVCIEDSVFPKRCSFYAGFVRALVSIEEFCGKLRAAKAAQYHPDFLLIARTEALIAGGTCEQALARAHAYADAGADMVLVHSKAATPDEVVQVARAWQRDVPLVCVPTTYDKVSATDLATAGFRMMIYANHGLRAAVAAMQQVLGDVRRATCTAGVEGAIAPMSTLYDLVNVAGLTEHERRFLPSATDVAV